MCVWSHLNLSLALFISQYSSIVNTPCGLDFSWVWFTFLDHYGSLATLAVVTRESALCYILFKYEHQALCLIDLKERHIVKSKSDSVSVAREMTLAVWNIYLSCPLFCRIPLARYSSWMSKFILQDCALVCASDECMGGHISAYLPIHSTSGHSTASRLSWAKEPNICVWPLSFISTVFPIFNMAPFIWMESLICIE